MTVRTAWMLLAALHAGPVAAGLRWGIPAGIAAMVAMHAALLILTLWPHSPLGGRSVRRIPCAGARRVCLTIDDGPCDDTPDLLNALNAAGARATFFLIGDRTLDRPGDVREIVRRGHAIANHTQSHPATGFWRYGPAAQRREIENCQDSLRPITGAAPAWFRAPAGFRNLFNGAILREAGLCCAGWHARGFDTSTDDIPRIVRRLTRRLRPGAILLVHQGRPHSVALLQALLADLHKAGWSADILLTDGPQSPVSS